MRIVLLIGAFYFGFITSSKAQVKYDYAIISYSAWYKKIEISVSGEIYNSIDLQKDEIKGTFDMNPLIKQVNEMINEGWEVYDNEISTHGGNLNSYIQYCYLRKDK